MTFVDSALFNEREASSEHFWGDSALFNEREASSERAYSVVPPTSVCSTRSTLPLHLKDRRPRARLLAQFYSLTGRI